MIIKFRKSQRQLKCIHKTTNDENAKIACSIKDLYHASNSEATDEKGFSKEWDDA